MKRLCAIVLAGLLAGCASGGFVATGKSRSAVTRETVQLLSDAPTGHFEVLGHVSTLGTTKAKAEKNLRMHAADAGANAVILGTVDGNGWRGWRMAGKAIFIDSTPAK